MIESIRLDILWIKKYTEVLSDCTEEFVSNEMDIKDGTEYSLYIINCSNKNIDVFRKCFRKSR